MTTRSIKRPTQGANGRYGARSHPTFGNAIADDSEDLADRVSIVVITRNRRREVTRSLEQLRHNGAHVPVIVVDNGSQDGTANEIASTYPTVKIVALAENLGAAGRNIGVASARTPYVAFSDDDSWWDAGALETAACILDQHRRVAVVAARVMVEPHGELDPVCAEMAESPLGCGPDLAGPSVLGFVACGAVVRRSAFLDAGGFPVGYGLGGEEAPLALALAAEDWALVYVDAIVARHRPSPIRDHDERVRRQFRNDVWTAWLRLPVPRAMQATADIAFDGDGQGRSALHGALDALVGLPRMWHHRRVVPRSVRHQWLAVQRRARRA